MSIRRFPPPPGTHSTPKQTPRETRSKEAPMDYEFETPRTFPGSPFAMKVDEDGERARKRTHYEAMDVDTPPRPSVPSPQSHSSTSASFPPSATSTSNPFHFQKDPSPPPPLDSPDLHFDKDSFSPKKAFGLASPPPEEIDMEDKENSALTFVGGFKGDSTRHRKSRRQRSKGDDEEDEDEDLGGKVGRRLQGSDFSFQVHHHHAPSGSESGPMGAASTPGKWLHNATPYTLLGYLQFASFALLSLLLLALSLFFLQTLYHDIQTKLSSLTTQIRAEIHSCAKAYVDNKCQPETRLPFMEGKCQGWEECMGQEVVVVGRSRVIAETVAEVFNGFFEVISFKTMLFVLLTLGLIVYTTGLALSNLPSRPHAPPPHHYPMSPYHHIPSYEYPLSNAQGLGWGPPPPLQSQAKGLEPASTMGQEKKKKGWF